MGERVRELRLKRKLTQARLAQLAGVAENTLRGLEKGSLQTRRAIYLKVCDALGTTPDAMERPLDVIDEGHPLLNGLNEDDLRIAQAYSRARTALRLQVEQLLFSAAAADTDRGFLDLYEQYTRLNASHQHTLRRIAASQLQAQDKEQQHAKTDKTQTSKKR